MYDIFFVGKKNSLYKNLKNKFVLLKHAESIEQAQLLSLTKFTWIVYDDLLVHENFDFTYQPDNWSSNYIHVFLNKDKYDGICLIPKHINIAQKEIKIRSYKNQKQVEILASKPRLYEVFAVDNYDEYLTAYNNSETELFWAISNNIDILENFKFDLYFAHDNEYDRKQNHAFIHLVNNKQTYNGIFLFSKHKPVTQKEIEHRHLVERKEWAIVASGPKLYDQFVIDTYDEYLTALENTTTELFWGTSRNISIADDFKFDLYFNHNNFYDRKENHAFIHRIKDKDYYNGIFLFSKHSPVTKREIEHRHLVKRKEWNIIASGPIKYDIFNVITYNDYKNALTNSKTELFWVIPEYVNPVKQFKYDVYFNHDEVFDRSINHVYKNGKYNDGIMLCSKKSPITEKEFNYKFINNKKENSIIVSTPKPYDIVFISYQEPKSDIYFKFLKDRFPNAKRVHGVKGIHQAHIAAAKLCSTNMFWVVDGDALIDSNFKFNYQVAQWDKDIVHVWRSINPINDLVYGYGGVKLLPRDLTINMDTTKPDMTTSISKKFIAIEEISNITAFNTDPFNTWKSAFRECVKLSSAVIDRQKQEETYIRLNVWCTVGKDRPFGKYAIDGAIEGKKYGELYKNDINLIAKINNFDWLQEQFNARNL